VSGALLARGLACARGGRMVASGIDLDLGPGEALHLRGPNGSGKSSLLRVLAGFLAPAAGTLRMEGRDIAHDPAEHRARLHYLGHADAIKPVLTVEENLAFSAGIAGVAGARLDDALAAFGLLPLADTPGRLLSAGQRRRAALARLLAPRRPLWLLDEPETGLDARSRARLATVLQDHLDGGGMAVVASHGALGIEGIRVLELEEPG
jgi:heme exporter protein A